MRANGAIQWGLGELAGGGGGGPLCLPTVRAQGVHPWLRQEQQMDQRGGQDGQKGGAGGGWRMERLKACFPSVRKPGRSFSL